MTTDDVVVDVGCWPAMCSGAFMQGLGRTSDSVDYSARCRQVRALGGDCNDSCLLQMTAWHWSLAMPPEKASPRHSRSPVCSPHIVLPFRFPMVRRSGLVNRPLL
jgi:hypothetical protein